MATHWPLTPREVVAQLSINALFFAAFEDNGNQYLSRAWMIDPEINEEHAEYLVPVEWLYTVPRSQAFREVGLFGNQTTVCKPTASKWRHTVERLRETWSLPESQSH